MAELKKANFTIVFPDEGNEVVRIPQANLLHYASPKNKMKVKSLLHFIGRPSKEVLLRKIIFTLYEEGQISRNKSIIDIGAWISDNTLVWSKFLDDKKAVVYAIDPAEENIFFGQRLAKYNKCNNIQWHVAVCSDKPGQELYFDGNLGHAQFSTNSEEKYKPSPLRSQTLDQIVGNQGVSDIGLIHVDVEGLEGKVLAGALNIIESSRPSILFEQHINTENPGNIADMLSPYGYQTYMINELLPGCNYDCRNFLSIPEDVDISVVQKRALITETKHQVWPATTGLPLVQM